METCKYTYDLDYDALSLTIIHWDLALHEVSGDKKFLDEILQDLLNESDEANLELREAIKICNLDKVGQEAHKINGSASYLHCEQICCITHIIMKRIMSSSKCATEEEINLLWKQISIDYKIFKQALRNLEREITKR